MGDGKMEEGKRMREEGRWKKEDGRSVILSTSAP
jgi:hypothetical protein